VDGRPNGHLGRIRWQQQPKHGRQILRANWFHAHTHADGNCHDNAAADCITDTARAISYTITYAYGNRYSNAGTASYSHSEASPNTSTTSVALLMKEKQSPALANPAYEKTN
jgi:hypothetical protein